MADKKISELTALPSSGFATDDLIPIVDTSAVETKQTSIADLDARYAGSGVTQYTDELAQDAVGGILTDTATINFTYTDGTPSITADVLDGSITNAKVATGIDAVKLADGSVTNAELQFINTLSSNAQTQIDGKISTTLADGNILVGNASNIATSVNPSGDVDISNAGVFSIASGAIVNADVNASAAIDFSKLAPLSSANILVGNGSNVAASVAMSGDVTINNAGSTTVGAQKVGVSKMTLAANSFAANNTGSTAAPTEVTYKSVAATTYSGSISFTASVAPSGATTNQYTWQQVGDLVTLVISLKYASAGTSVQAVAMELPGDVPSPVELSGNTAASDRIANGSGWIETTSSAAAGAARCYIRRNAGDTAYEMFIQAGASNAAYAQGTVVYRTV